MPLACNGQRDDQGDMSWPDPALWAVAQTGYQNMLSDLSACVIHDGLLPSIKSTLG